MSQLQDIPSDLKFDIDQIRLDFPILNERVNGKPLIYFDNGATAQKPIQVTNAINDYYNHYNSNVHRGVHTLSQKATEAYENARETVKEFIHAAHNHEIIFTRGTTSAINTVAFSFGRRFLEPGDEVFITAMEHHANIVPWQMICEERKAILKVIPISDQGELHEEFIQKNLNSKVKILALTHISNVLGTINPIQKIIAKAHEFGTRVLIDGAQSIQHLDINVGELDCDFFCFSGHKLYGPAGIGVLYGKEELLNQMPPFEFGGDMIKDVTFAKTTFNTLPYKFEAGTPNIEGAIGLAAAIRYVQNVGMNRIQQYENSLKNYTAIRLKALKSYRPIGTAGEKSGVFSFLIQQTHPADVGILLDKFGIAVRTGHHCAQPLMDWYQIPGTVRVSLAFYNTFEEIDYLAECLLKIEKMLVS